MGLFDKLFGKSKSDVNQEAGEAELRQAYNVMKNIQLVQLDRYEDSERYKHVENGIYQDLSDEEEANFRMTLSYELEDEEDSQYPLEDILDRYLMHVSDFLEDENEQGTNRYVFEFGGFLNRMKEAQEMIGKKVYNQDFKDEDGQVRVRLVIE